MIMNKKINLVELLKDCPSGMELNCLIYEDVYFDYVDEFDKIHCYIQHETYRTSFTFNQYGTHSNDTKSKCVIFPKGKTSWEGFQRPFINGDVIVDKTGAIAIYKQVHKSYEDPIIDFHCRLTSANKGLFQKNGIGSLYHCWEIDSARFATQEEKEKLFEAIKSNGYEWNPKTKTLDDLTIPMFKVGNCIQSKTDNKLKKYEYQQVEYSNYPSPEELNEKGIDGWELIQVFSTKRQYFDSDLGYNYTKDVYKAIFKREIF